MGRIANFVFAMCSALFLFVVLSACSSETGSVKQTVDYQKQLTKINPEFMIMPDEAYKWHLDKDKRGPTYSGSESWRSYMSSQCAGAATGSIAALRQPAKN